MMNKILEILKKYKFLFAATFLLIVMLALIISVVATPIKYDTRLNRDMLHDPPRYEYYEKLNSEYVALYKETIIKQAKIGVKFEDNTNYAIDKSPNADDVVLKFAVVNLYKDVRMIDVVGTPKVDIKTEEFLDMSNGEPGVKIERYYITIKFDKVQYIAFTSNENYVYNGMDTGYITYAVQVVLSQRYVDKFGVPKTEEMPM